MVQEKLNDGWIVAELSAGHLLIFHSEAYLGGSMLARQPNSISRGTQAKSFASHSSERFAIFKPYTYNL
jgi:hypothetical protein